jgi:hypothetical protein
LGTGEKPRHRCELTGLRVSSSRYCAFVDISPVVAAIVASFLTAALSIVVQLVANSHARKMAVADRAAALEIERGRQRFEARERRYEDRRDAVTELHDALVEVQIVMHRSRVLTDSKNDAMRKATWAMAKVVMQCPAVVADAAVAANAEAQKVSADGTLTTTALKAFREASRTMLSEELPPDRPAPC